MNNALLDWKIEHDEEKQYTDPYMYGLNLSPCFHFKINLKCSESFPSATMHFLLNDNFRP